MSRNGHLSPVLELRLISPMLLKQIALLQLGLEYAVALQKAVVTDLRRVPVDHLHRTRIAYHEPRISMWTPSRYFQSDMERSKDETRGLYRREQRKKKGLKRYVPQAPTTHPGHDMQTSPAVKWPHGFAAAANFFLKKKRKMGPTPFFPSYSLASLTNASYSKLAPCISFCNCASLSGWP